MLLTCPIGQILQECVKFLIKICLNLCNWTGTKEDYDANSHKNRDDELNAGVIWDLSKLDYQVKVQ